MLGLLADLPQHVQCGVSADEECTMTHSDRTSRASPLSIAALLAAALLSMGCSEREERSSDPSQGALGGQDPGAVQPEITVVQRDPDVLYNAFAAASLDPEGFDSYVQQHPEMRSEHFSSCLAASKIRLITLHQTLTQSCHADPDVISRTACQNTEASRVSLVLDGIAATVRGEAQYTSTMAGVAALGGKRVWGTQAFEQMTRGYLPTFKPALTCS
jgi:hypothetical protein